MVLCCLFLQCCYVRFFKLVYESSYITQRHITLQAVDPCEDLTDDDIRTALQNATGPKSALFIPEVCLDVLLVFIVKRNHMTLKYSSLNVTASNYYVILFPTE